MYFKKFNSGLGLVDTRGQALLHPRSLDLGQEAFHPQTLPPGSWAPLMVNEYRVEKQERMKQNYSCAREKGRSEEVGAVRNELR